MNLIHKWCWYGTGEQCIHQVHGSKFHSGASPSLYVLALELVRTFDSVPGKD